MRRYSWIAIVVVISVLAGCGSMFRLAYNHADLAVRIAANDYFDFDSEQLAAFKPRLDAFLAWHRRAELPLYAALATDARERVVRTLSSADVPWALEQIRARYRVAAAKAIDDVMPVLATLTPANLTALERKFAKSNAELEADYWTGDERERLAGRLKRLKGRFDDWLGTPTAEQEAILLAYVKSSPNYSIERLADRRQRQQAFIAILREHRKSPDFAARLKRYFTEYERDRVPGYAERAREWDASLAQLVTDIDRALKPEQRTRLAARLARYADDFRRLAADDGTGERAEKPAVSSGQ